LVLGLNRKTILGPTEEKIWTDLVNSIRPIFRCYWSGCRKVSAVFRSSVSQINDERLEYV
jgi:hypothetical protein